MKYLYSKTKLVVGPLKVWLIFSEYPQLNKLNPQIYVPPKMNNRNIANVQMIHSLTEGSYLLELTWLGYDTVNF